MRGGTRPTWEKDESLNTNLFDLSLEDNIDDVKIVGPHEHNLETYKRAIEKENEDNEKLDRKYEELQGHVNYDKIKLVTDYIKEIFPDQDERNCLLRWTIGNLMQNSDERTPFDDYEKMCLKIRKSRAKKLIILDMNGLLIHRLFTKNKESKDILPDVKHIGNFLVWKRPGAEELLNFLLENFDVAIWSSMSKYNLNPFVNYIFDDSENNRKDKLKFVWDQTNCESVKHPETDKKPLFLKNISDVCKEFPEYEKYNILLVDDSKLKSRNNSPYNLYLVDDWKGDMADNQLTETGNVGRFFRQLNESNLSIKAFMKHLSTQ